MKKITIFLAVLFVFFFSIVAYTGSKQKGEKCFSDIECDSSLECNDGVCIKKKEFDFGSSGKTGKECNNDADCIGSGKCEAGSFGKKYCTGN